MKLLNSLLYFDWHNFLLIASACTDTFSPPPPPHPGLTPHFSGYVPRQREKWGLQSELERINGGLRDYDIVENAHAVPMDGRVWLAHAQLRLSNYYKFQVSYFHYLVLMPRHMLWFFLLQWTKLLKKSLEIWVWSIIFPFS